MHIDDEIFQNKYYLEASEFWKMRLFENFHEVDSFFFKGIFYSCLHIYLSLI